MIKHIIREVAPECSDFEFYFEDDGLTSASGDFCNNLFILGGRRCGDFNMTEYKDIQNTMRGIIDGFSDVAEGYKDYFQSYKAVMDYYKVPYTSRRCRDLKQWAPNGDEDDPESVALYLTIVTGKKWDVMGVCGYCQGDYVEVVYCKDHYKNGVRNYGEIWLGCGKEFCVIDVEDYAEPEEDGDDPEYKEVSSCYGYIVADCEAWRDTDYKVLVCDWAGIDFDETRLELIDDCHTYTKYSYRIA